MAAWWLKARARLNLMWSRSNMTSFSDICLCCVVKYLESPQRISVSNSVHNRAEVVEHPPRPTRGLVLSYGANTYGAWASWESQKCYMERDRASVLSVIRAILGYGNANAICSPEPDPLMDIRLESGDIVEIIEGDVDVVTEVEEVPDGAFRWS